MADFEVRAAPGRVVLAGEIDLRCGADLRRALDAAQDPGPEVVIDLTDVTFIDSTGINELMRATNAGCALTLHRPQAPVRRVIELVGLDQVARVQI